MLADTAVVGHLGTAELGGLAVANSAILGAYALFIFLAYGTTAAVSRLIGAGEEGEAAHQAIQSVWLALVIGVVLVVLGLLSAEWVVDALGADGAVRTNALIYLRIGLLGVPAFLITMAGAGYLRGLQNTAGPLIVAVGYRNAEPRRRGRAHLRLRLRHRRVRVRDDAGAVGGRGRLRALGHPSCERPWRHASPRRRGDPPAGAVRCRAARADGRAARRDHDVDRGRGSHGRRRAGRARDRVRRAHVPGARPRRGRDRGPGDHRPPARRRGRRGREGRGATDGAVGRRARRRGRRAAVRPRGRAARGVQQRSRGGRARPASSWCGSRCSNR